MPTPIRIVAVALASFAVVVAGEDAEHADQIWYGGVIHPDSDQAVVESIAVRDGRVIALGKLDKIEKRTRGDGTEMIDLAGKTLVPGWIEVHARPWLVGLHAEAVVLDPGPRGAGRSVAAIQDALRAARDVVEFGVGERRWLVGVGYDETELDERRHPTREDLDAVAADVPVIVVHRAGYVVVGNSAALARVGFDRDARDPPGGAVLRRGVDLEPCGVLEGTAAQVVLDAMITDVGIARATRWVERGVERFAEGGFTTVVESRIPAALIPSYVQAAEQRRLAIDVVAYPNVAALAEADSAIGKSYGDEGHGRFRVGGVELVLDGRLRSGTARLSAPYTGSAPGRPDAYAGDSWYFDDEVLDILSRVYASGWDLLVHAEGDGAVDQLLRAVRTAANKLPIKGRRTVLTDAAMIRPEQFEALEELRIVPSFCPTLATSWDARDRDRALGPVRASTLFVPVEGARSRRLRFSLHGDAADRVTGGIEILEAAVGEDHGLSADAAMHALTEWAAYQIAEDDAKGRIAPGSLADFTVLSGDPLNEEPEALRDNRVVETVKEGRIVAGGPFSARDNSRTSTSPANRGRGSTRTRTGRP